MEPLFQTTSWSLISRSRESGESAREATSALCRLYWGPLYVYARRTGLSEYEAEDLVQGFMLHVVEHDVFSRAEQERGRFRTFLLCSLKQYLGRRVRDASRLKRSPRAGLLSIDVEGAERLAARIGDGEMISPANAFERAWALAQIELAWEAVETDYRESKKLELFAALRPVVGHRESRSTREIANQLGMSEGAVNVAAHRLRRRFGEALRAHVAKTLMSDEDVEDEIARLQAALSGHGV